MVCGTCSAQTRDDARVNEEREEAEVMIACGFDVHRAQITFDLVDHETGGVRRVRILPATREQLRLGLCYGATAGLAGGGGGTIGRRRVQAGVGGGGGGGGPG